MHTSLTSIWLDDWLSGPVRAPVSAPAPAVGTALDARRERFVIGRSITALAALVAMPAYLLSERTPGILNAVAALAWLSPLVAVFVLSRGGGGLAPAQSIVTLALGACAAAGAALAPLPVFAAGAAGLLIVADAAAFPSRRGLALAALAATAAPVLAILVGAGSAGADWVDMGGVAFSVAVPFALGHALSFVLVEGRLAARLRAQEAQDAVGETATLRAVDDLVTWHDPQGSVLRATRASSRLLGVEPRNLDGSGLFTLIHVGDRPAYLMALSDAAHRGRSVALQLRVKARGGPSRTGDPAAPTSGAPVFLWMEMHAQPLRDPADRRCAVVCVLRDVAHTRQNIEALREACREADRRNEQRAQLLADVGHELRAPLGALLGQAELLAGRTMPLSAEQRLEYARSILHSGQHMLEVVDALVDLSEIEAGRVRLTLEPVDPVALVRECCASLAPAADQAGVVLRQDFTFDTPFLRADRRSCRRILHDLLSSAITITPRGSTIVVSLRRRADAVLFRLRDTGIAAVPADPARRGTPPAWGALQGGTIEGGGLALSVVRGLVKLHGGEFRIESAGDAGITVEVSLPIGPEAPTSTREVRHAKPGQAWKEARFQPDAQFKPEAPCPPMSIAG